MQNLPPPAPLSLEGNKSEQWMRWKRRWQNYVVASGLSGKPAAIQTAAFLHVLGDEGMAIYENIAWDSEGDEMRLDCMIGKLEAYFAPKKNITFDRHVFNTREQREGETLDDYVHVLQTLVKSCEYGPLTDSIVKDRIVAGLRDEKLRERLLEKADLTLDGAIQMLRAAEASKVQAKAFVKDQISSADVDAVRKIRSQAESAPSEKFKGGSSGRQEKNTGVNKHNERVTQGYYGNALNACRQCGTKHEFRNCPAYGATCFKCQGRNHFARVCFGQYRGRYNFGTSSRGYQRNVSALQTYDTNPNENNDDTETLFIGTVYSEIENCSYFAENDWHEILCINDKRVRFKLDTGAQCNILPKRIYDTLSVAPLLKSRVKLRSYTNQVLNPVGQTELICVHRGTKYKLLFQVIDGNYTTLIGKTDCEKMRMLTRQVSNVNVDKNDDNLKGIQNKMCASFFAKYSDLFSGLGTLPGYYTINIDESVAPVIHPPRKIPHALRAKVKQKLDEMEIEGIIKKVPNNEPTDWVSSLVTVEKPNGDVRVLIDPRDLNKAIKREHHPLKTVEEIAANLDGAKFFSKLDAKHAFHQIQLDEHSTKLLTFNTPFGRYKYLRMPMGIKSAPEVYQRRIQMILEGLPGVDAGMDDILVWGKTEDEHNNRLTAVLERLRENGFKLNKEKCEISVTSVKFLGHNFTSRGLEPNFNKCSAIEKMPKPENKDDVKRLLGMVNYFGKFIPNLSQLSSPLRELLKKDVEWHWLSDQETSFNQLLSALTNPPVLAYYNPSTPLILQVDACYKGVGAALLQEGRPVAFASKYLLGTNSKQNKKLHRLLCYTLNEDTHCTN